MANDVVSDPFARYISRVKDARLERLNTLGAGAPDGRSARSANAIMARKETLTRSQTEIESAKAPSSREIAEFTDRTGQFLREAASSAMIKRDYLAKTRPGLLGLPKRVGLRAIRYPVKTYTDGLFSQQEAFNSISASFISENAERTKLLLETGRELEHKARLQLDFNRNAVGGVSTMAEAISSLWAALQEQNEFNSLLVSVLNDVIDGSSELAASVKEEADRRLSTCEGRLDSAEDALRQQTKDNSERFDALQSHATSLFETLQTSLAETRDHVFGRLDAAETRIESESARTTAIEMRNDATESQLGRLDERCLKSESRLDGAETGLASLDNRYLENQRRSDELEGAVRAADNRFEGNERRLEDLSGQIVSNSQAITDTHSFFSLQLEAVDARVEHSQIRQHETSDWITKLEERLGDSEEWLGNLAKDLDSSREWVKNLDSQSQKHGEWLLGIESDVKSHSDWLENIEASIKEHADWLSTIAESKEQLSIWTGNLQQTQDSHASLLSDLARRQKEIDYQIVFVKRKLEEAGPSASAVQHGEKIIAANRLESGLSEDEYVIFEERFRGDSAILKARQERHLEHFEGCTNVIDIGCGRGEFLELLSQRGINCLGIDSNPEMVRICESRGLEVKEDDLVAFLEAADDGSFDGVFCSQVVEHFSPATVLRICKLIAQKLSPGGAVVVETIDPRSIYALVNSFLLDPSHVSPIHPELLKFGFSLTDVELEGIERLAPVPEGERLDFPDDSPAAEQAGGGTERTDKNFRAIDRFLFGFQDYALVGRKPKA
ncbi:MAG: methyltransferase domain-containing protein [Candidatus Coatesbacteria bacterium]|nr:methyltransferase domain-containing protein [Candidatus Coatesbacteria bacterium]